jgi:hypothetical protein
LPMRTPAADSVSAGGARSRHWMSVRLDEREAA